MSAENLSIGQVGLESDNMNSRISPTSSTIHGPDSSAYPTCDIHSQHTGVDQPALIDPSALGGDNRQSNWPVAT